MVENFAVLIVIALGLAIFLGTRAAQEARESQRKRWEKSFKDLFGFEAPKVEDERALLQRHVDAKLESLALAFQTSDEASRRLEIEYEKLKNPRRPLSTNPKEELAELRVAREAWRKASLSSYENAGVFFQARALAKNLGFRVSEEENLDAYLPKEKCAS